MNLSKCTENRRGFIEIAAVPRSAIFQRTCCARPALSATPAPFRLVCRYCNQRWDPAFRSLNAPAPALVTGEFQNARAHRRTRRVSSSWRSTRSARCSGNPPHATHIRVGVHLRVPSVLSSCTRRFHPLNQFVRDGPNDDNAARRRSQKRRFQSDPGWHPAPAHDPTVCSDFVKRNK